MSGPWKRGSGAYLALGLVVLIGLVALAACGDSSSSTSSSPSAAATTPSASPSIVPAAEPVHRWDAPGSASLAQTQTVGKRYAEAQTTETIPEAGLYAKGATFDYWASGETHNQGAKQIESTYKAAGEGKPGVGFDWTRVRLLVAPGVVAYEGLLAIPADKVKMPYLELLAVDGNKIIHEEIFMDPGPQTKQPVRYADSAPGPKDTAKVAAEVAAAVGAAFAAGDQAALQDLLAPDVLFYDTELTHGVRGVDAVLAWHSKTPTVEVSNQEPITGPGWAVVRWTVRETYETGVQAAMPGATVMEVRDGKVVRMTLYYDNAVIGLQG
jgi:ketosteroid isomerase-like protein